ncbi:uncharacterized protein IL334_003963 [Kwoniella shivajii]|uniref:FAD dependent oxidoreductase domain-containing protein n=1 Tax=Kwoniella shivajii TaxID=564305 RepID=A0ABZ1CZ20_9TREE|nr:hypothetical protein IL334_003963 [Kwoniella shivajii]
MSSTNSTQRPIVILGAGIIGLTTAVRILESPLYQEEKIPIHIIADHLPNDPLDPKYASTIAGAHHLSFADDEDVNQTKWDKRTFHVMYNEWKNEGEKTGLMVLKQTELFVKHNQHLKIYEDHPDFQVIEPDQLPKGIDHSVNFTSLTMTPFTYLNRLLDRISALSNGQVMIHRHHLPSLSSLSHPSITAMIGEIPPLAIVVCVGIGAITLGQVEDQTVFPTRGQVVKVKAPWIRSGFTRQVGELNGGEGGERTYVIPRPDGEVILGGTRELNDWYPYPREETTKDILKRVLEICPDLCPKYKIAPSALAPEQDIEKLHITEDNLPDSDTDPTSPLEELVIQTLVGFRPSRKGGIRLERGKDLVLGRDHGKQDKTIVVHNYGHGGAGWQSCWGTAEDAVEILIKSM